ILCAAGLFVFAHPSVVAIIETGRFGAADSERVAGLLKIIAVAVPAWIVQQIAVRAFYARGQMWLPMLLGTGIALAFIPLYVALGTDAEGLATAGVIGMATSALATLALARVRHGGPQLAPLVSSAIRSLLIAAVAAVVGAWVGARFTGALATLALGGAVFAVVCMVGVWLVGDAPLREALSRAVKRVARLSG
ncbi:MAG: lipid II flippase MurJ, partial [Myxococcota bacterium]